MRRRYKRYRNNFRYPIYIPVLLMISVLFLSIGFSAFQENMLVTDTVADIRLKKDIRVTNASQLELSTDSYLNSLDYNKTNISGLAGLPYSDSSITVNVEITNIEAQEMGIYDLVLNNPNLDYRINNYTKKDKLCDDTNTSKCNLGSTSNISITIFYKENMYNSENIEQNFILDFDFRGFYTITYTDIPGTYQNSIMDTETLEVDLGENALDKIMITMGGVRLTNQEYTYINGVITIPNIDGNIEISPFVTDPSCFVSTARATINNYICEDTDVVIPKNLMLAINGTGTEYKVTTIGNNAFKEKGLTSVVISDDITSIGLSAFQNNSLTSIDIPDSVTTLGNYAFENNSLVSVKLSNNLKGTGSYTFQNNLIESITFPSKVTTVGEFAFYNNHISELIIPSNITSIQQRAFEKNYIEELFLPNTVTSIGQIAFASNHLYSLTIEDGITVLSNYIFYDNRLTEIKIPDSVTSIGLSAFQSNYIETADLPSGLKSIPRSLFQNNLLTSIDIPDSVTSIGVYAFNNNKLTSIEIPNSVTSINGTAFMYNNLTSIRIGSGLTTIPAESFRSGTQTRTKYDGTVITYGPNRVTSVIINNSSSNVSGYAPYTFGWASGYSNANICWLLDNPTCGD